LALLQKFKNKITKYGSSATMTADFFQNPVLHIAAGRCASYKKSHRTLGTFGFADTQAKP